jgi:hypothetical protein
MITGRSRRRARHRVSVRLEADDPVVHPAALEALRKGWQKYLD